MPCNYKHSKLQRCQLDLPEEEIITLADKSQWCEYHCPIKIVTEESITEDTEKRNWSEKKITQSLERIKQWNRLATDNNNVLDLQGVIVTGITDFSSTPFHEVSFELAQFYGHTNFSKAIFTKVNFRDAIFHDSVSFLLATFTASANFQSTVFAGNAIFNQAHVGNAIDFRYSEFLTSGSFVNFKVKEGDFSNIYMRHSDFKGLKGKEHGNVSFADATLSSSDFSNAYFHSPAIFKRVAFKKKTYFINANFESFAEFRGAEFECHTEFSCLPDHNKNNFSTVDFSKSTFTGEANFNNRNFNNSTDFSNATFHIAPTFHSTLLHQDTDFNGTVFKDRKSEHAERAYRTLRLAMEEHRARKEQGKFFAYEQESARKNMKYSLNRAFSWLYMVSSDYGRNPIKPLIMMLAILILANPLYCRMDDSKNPYGFYSNQFSYIKYNDANDTVYKEIMAFSFRQIIQPFSVWKLTEPKHNNLSWVSDEHINWLRFTATLQSLLSMILIALSLLAFRWRFKRG